MRFAIHLFPRGLRPTTAENVAVAVLRSRLEELAPSFKRLSLRVDEIIGTDGEPEITCKVKVTLAKALSAGRAGKTSDTPSFVVEALAAHVRDAAELAADGIEGEVRRAIEEGHTPPGRRASRVAGRAPPPPKTIAVRRARDGDADALLGDGNAVLLQSGRWAGKEGMTAHPHRGRHLHMTRHQARATSARETSSTRPSRKSTRKSANRSKRDSNLVRKARSQSGRSAPSKKTAERRSTKVEG